MEKNQIQEKLRNALQEFVPNHKNQAAGEEGQTKSHTARDFQKNAVKGKKDYADVRRAFNTLGAPSMVDVMKLTGTPDDENGTNRSLFRKKVKQIKNKDTGSYYQFDDEELNQVRAALDIKK